MFTLVFAVFQCPAALDIPNYVASGEISLCLFARIDPRDRIIPLSRQVAFTPSGQEMIAEMANKAWLL
jgi:hypothetical protein